MTPPIVSIIVVARNESKKISACITSLTQQTFDKALLEIILVDDGSTDDTVTIAKSCCPNINIIHEPSRSISHSRNIGWRTARGQYIAYIDADCTAPPHWIETLKEAIEKHQCDAVGGSNAPPKNNSKFYDTLSIMLNSFAGSHTSVQGRIFKNHHRVRHLPGLNIMLKRSILVLLDGYDESMALVGEDEDLSCRIAYMGGTMQYIANAQVTHYQRDDIKSWGRNMFTYGKGRTWLAKRHPKYASPIFLLPIAAAILYPVYLPLIVLYSMILCIRDNSFSKAGKVALLFNATHIPYAFGLLYGLFVHGDTKKSNERKNKKTMLMVLKNAGNKGDEAIILSCTNRFIDYYESDKHELGNIYIFGFGPTGIDIRQLPRTKRAAQKQVFDMLAPLPCSRTTHFSQLLDIKYLIYIIISRTTLIISGGQWFHDLNKVNHFVISSIFFALRFTGGRTAIFSVGIGPLKSRFSRFMLRCALGKKSFMSVRDQNSKQLLHQSGRKNVCIYPDPAIELQNINFNDGILTSHNKSKYIIGISPCAWASFDNIYKKNNNVIENTFEQLIKLITGLDKLACKVVLIPTMNPEDYKLCKEIESSISDHINIDVIDTGYLYSGQIQKLISQLNLLISMRLHPIIFANNTGTPYIALNYAEKVQQFCAQQNTLHRLVELKSKDWASETFEKAEDIINRKDKTHTNTTSTNILELKKLDDAYKKLFTWVQCK